MTDVIVQGMCMVVGVMLAAVFGVPLLVRETAMLSHTSLTAPHLVTQQAQWTVNHLAIPIYLLQLFLFLLLVVMAVSRPKWWVMSAIMWLVVLLGVVLCIFLYQHRDDLNNLGCAFHCTMLVRNVTEIRDVEGTKSLDGAFCEHETGKYGAVAGCFVHDPDVVAAFRTNGLVGHFIMWCILAGLTALLAFRSHTPQEKDTNLPIV